ncbi:hypothetical protein C7271_05475 [filamentous cyanobacterium CCP5]|nr:hypothetical protein C7271_05475 [filamentous cyanobacterium CCP5]
MTSSMNRYPGGSMLTLYPNAVSPLFSTPFERLATATFPAIELRETADEIVVTACLPGVDPRDIQVQADDRSLVFYGQQRRQLRNHYRYTTSYEQFQHVIPLPAAVSDRQMQVAYRGDRLIVTLPKASQPLRSVAQNLQAQGQTLRRYWQQAKTWLGHRLQAWAERLLAG